MYIYIQIVNAIILKQMKQISLKFTCASKHNGDPMRECFQVTKEIFPLEF